MLQKRLHRSSTNSSKRLNRRVRITFDFTKGTVKRFLPIAIIIVAVILVGKLFTINQVNCSFNGGECPQEIQVVFNKIIGSNSLFVNQKELLTFVKAVYPVDKMSVSYRSINTLSVDLQGTSPNIFINAYLVSTLPVLSMDQAPSSTDSAGWWVKPTGELETFVVSQKPLGFNIWENGTMTSAATAEANINYIFSSKPSPETISSIFKAIKLILKYIDVSKIYVVNNRCFLSRPNEPDIIIGVPFDEGSLSQALQSITYLATIKKDAKVIDLSFKNPILR